MTSERGDFTGKSWKQFRNTLRRSTSFPQTVKGFAILFVVIFTYLQILDSRSEYPFLMEISPETWHIHHDEKLIVPDARYLFLKNTRAIDFSDYRPYPVSAAFGIAGPALASLGFKIWGLNNVGLRVFFILIGGLATLFSVLCILRLSPNLVGMVFSLMYLINYNNFVLTRHAILENALTLFLTGVMVIYLSNRAFFLRNMHWIGFGAALCTFFKINFPPYVYLLIFLIAFGEKQGLRAIFKLTLWSSIGIVIFEGLHLCILWQMGIAQWRFYNLWQAFSSHTGVDYQSEGLNIFLTFPGMLAEWSGMSISFIRQVSQFVSMGVGNFSILTGLGVLFVMSLGYSVYRGWYKTISRQVWVIIGFLVLYLMLSANFFFYLKRAVSLFPLTFILLSYLSQRLIQKLSTLSPKFRPLLTGLLFLIMALSLRSQISAFTHGLKLSNKRVEENSIALDNDVPEGSVVFLHCFAYRFLWQAKKVRMLSADDQFMNNAMIVEWAVKNRAKYVVISGRAGHISETFPQIKSHRILKEYYTTESESDLPDRYMLSEIIYRE